MSYRICAVTSTRADYGLLRNTLLRLNDNAKAELDLVVTGTHLLAGFGSTKNEIEKDGFRGFTELPIELSDDTGEGMSRQTGAAMIKFAEYFGSNRPDLLLVLGDRFEIFAAASAAALMNIPIAHISGGDVTEGAVDDMIRHCITKMSSLHFAGCGQSAKRIIQMGEQPDTVFDVGEPGVENCLEMPVMTREELADDLGFGGMNGDLAVVTFHPVTRDSVSGADQLSALIEAMKARPGLSYIVTLSNADAGGRAFNEMWCSEGRKHDNWLVVPSLGIKRYISVMKLSRMVIGNSSSGIIEAPALHVPTINIGSRQKGRMTADSVLNCEPSVKAILAAMDKALTPEFREMCRGVKSFFGDGNTSAQIERELMKQLRQGRLSSVKHFYDIKSPDRES